MIYMWQAAFPNIDFLSSDFWSNLNFGQVMTDIQKAMHKSPPCIRTGGLKKGLAMYFKATTGGLWNPSPPISETLCHCSNSIKNLGYGSVWFRAPKFAQGFFRGYWHAVPTFWALIFSYVCDGIAPLAQGLWTWWRQASQDTLWWP